MTKVVANKDVKAFDFDCNDLTANQGDGKSNENEGDVCEDLRSKLTMAQINFNEVCEKERKMNPELVVEKSNVCDEERFGWNDCFVFIIFPKSRAQAYRNAAVKEKAILSRYSIYKPGASVGFAYQVQVIEGNWSPTYSIGIFKFGTYNDAKMWLESDNQFRQQDFLTHVDIWIAPIKNEDLCKKGYPITLIISQKVCFFKDIFIHKYLPSEEASIITHVGNPFVVNHEKPYCWRGTPPPGHTIVSQFSTIANFERYLASDEYKTLADYRKFTGNGFMIMAEMETDI